MVDENESKSEMVQAAKENYNDDDDDVEDV